MKVELSPKAHKSLSRLNNPIRRRILNALDKLEEEPPQGNIIAMSGGEGFRSRVGGYRILFQVMSNSIVVVDIGPRGEIYKRR